MHAFKTAAAYIRVSTQEQTEYSPESQLKAIRDYAQHHNLVLPEELIFADEGLSGRSAQKRPGFQRMIHLAKTRPRPFDVILLWKYSRFSRSREDSVVYKALLRRECGIQVVSVSEPVGQDKMSVLIEAVIEAMDEYYSLNLAEEVRRGMTEKRFRGEPVSAPPIGYRMEKGHFVVDEEGMRTVRTVYRMFLEGESAADIAAQLEAMGLRTRRGNPFETRSVLYLLRNPVYTGLIGTVVSHEPIVSEEEFARVQERLECTARCGRRSNPRREEYALRSLVHCSACGGMMTRSGTRMQCAAYARGRCTVSHSVAYAALEERVLRRISDDFEECRLPVIKQDRASENEKRTEEKIERLNRAYENGFLSLEEAAARRKELRREAALSEKTHTEQNRRLRELMEQCDGREKNRLLLAFVERVVFDRRENRVSVYYFDASSSFAKRGS